MRFKGYWRKINGNHAEFIKFNSLDYKDAKVPFSPYAGMPVLEAYHLVNQWNRQSANQSPLRTRSPYIFWLMEE